MKVTILGLTALFCCCVALAKAQEAPTGETLDTFNWTSEEVAPLIADRANTYSRFIPSFPTQLPLNYSGTSPKQFTLRTLGPAVVSRITAKRYAIVGKLRYSNVPSGSYLEMWSYFAPEQPSGPEGAYFTRTLGDSGPMAKLEGTDDGSDFALPFDATGAKTKLVRLVMNLHLAGPGSVALSDVKLIQYPDGEAAKTGQTPEANPMVIADLPIEKYLSSEQDRQDLLANVGKHDTSEDKAQVTVVKEADGTSELLLVRTGTTGLCRTALLTIPQDVVSRITGTRYGIMGEVSYSVSDRGALNMYSIFSRTGLSAPDDLWFQAMDGPSWGARDDSMGLMEGNREWGKFYIGFDRRWADRRPNAELTFKRIIFNVLLDGSGTVHLRNLKLVQYPEPPPQPAAQAPPATPQVTAPTTPATGLDWKSFFLGVATTGVLLLAGGGIIFISRRWNRRRHERELRRIASLDS